MKFLLNILIAVYFLLPLSSAWSLDECTGSPLKTKYNSIPSSWHNCKATFIFTDKGFEGNKYVGEFKNRKLEGHGTFYYLADNKYKGDKHEGKYKDGNMHGKGTYTFANGQKYVGEFKNGIRHGQGTFTWPDGEGYVGEWKDDKYHVQGTYTYANGDKYIGEYKDGQKYGQGAYYYLADNQYKGGKYIGEFDVERNGQGTFFYANGDKYVGEWKDDKFHGQGTYFFADGRVQVGQYKDDNCPNCKEYAKGKYKGSVVADNNNRQNEQNQEAVERERRKSSEERRKREQAERELAKLKAQKKKEKESITSDTEPPQISITSSNVEDKQGIIEGVVVDNIEIAELTIDGELVAFDEDGNFTYSTFIPQKGKELVVQATDSKGLSNKKVVALQRKETSAQRTLNFTELNPLKLKGKKNENALALIIGVNNYLYAPEATYADRDASYFADFANNIIGIKNENIKTLSNAKAINTEIKIALKSWLKGYSTPNKTDIYIFFAGHGLASVDGKELYLLPYDGEPRLLGDTAILRSEIFDIVQSIQPKAVTVFLDACYSGQTREKDMILADARPIAIVPIESDVPKNFTVFSASSGSEISGSLPEADHGLFSYFLMKGLEGDADANNDKKITNGELHNYVRSNVTRQAVRLGREQTPQLQGDENRVLVEFN